MKLLLIFLTSILPNTIYAQDKLPNRSIKEFKHVSIGLNLSPDLCYRTLSNEDGSANANLIIKSRNNLEVAKLGYTTGVSFCFDIKKNISIETGLQYLNRGYQTKKQALVFDQLNTGTPTAIKFRYNYHYLDLPVKVNFAICTNSLQFMPALGLVANVLVKQTSKSFAEYTDGKTSKNTSSTHGSYRKFNVSPLVSAGLVYSVIKRVNFRFEPTFKYQLLKLVKAPISEHRWAAGLNFGLYYALK